MILQNAFISNDFENIPPTCVLIVNFKFTQLHCISFNMR